MNNFEKIKNMNIDEMAEMFFLSKPKCCGLCMGFYCGCLRAGSCVNAIKDWLKSSKPPYDFENNIEGKKWKM